MKRCAWLVLAACTADIVAPADGVAPSGAGGAPPSGPGVVPVSAKQCEGRGDIGASVLRRLSNAEYDASVRDLLGLSQEALPITLPAEGLTHGLKNDARAQAFTPEISGAYLEAADALGAGLIADSARRTRVIGCDPAMAGCLDAFVKRFGRRAFRRPLADDETARILAFAGAGDAWGAVGRAVSAMLASTKFLYVAEIGSPVSGRSGLVALSAYERATRLALLLWGMGPDDGLLDAARDGTFDDGTRLRALIDRLTQDPRTRAGQRQFTTAWLGLDRLPEVDKDATRFPSWNGELARAAREETERFVDDLMWRDVDFGEALTSRTSFVDAQLGKHYGVTAGSGWKQVSFTESQRGAGLLTQASLLALHGDTDANTPIKRGAFVRKTLLCEELPPPPPDVPAIGEARVGPEATARERLEAHRNNPGCSACHAQLDPVGYGLDAYDAVGAHRQTDGAGRPLDLHGKLVGPGGDVAFEGAAALGAAVRAQPQFATCIATQLFRWSAARKEEAQDACTVARIDDAFRKSDRRWGKLLQALVSDPSFALRRQP